MGRRTLFRLGALALVLAPLAVVSGGASAGAVTPGVYSLQPGQTVTVSRITFGGCDTLHVGYNVDSDTHEIANNVGRECNSLKATSLRIKNNTSNVESITFWLTDDYCGPPPTTWYSDSTDHAVATATAASISDGGAGTFCYSSNVPSIGQGNFNVTLKFSRVH